MRRTFLLGLVLAALGALTQPRSPAADPAPPAVAREFRAVWVATVANIDWPSKKGLPAAQQQDELRAILDKCQEIRANAVVFQVRPMADALYKSDLEPWSEFLTGTAGQDPGYDPLEFAVKEAHARGLELHAWFNPYRAWAPSGKSDVPASHLVKARPELAKKFGGYAWLNPTHKDVQEHSLKVFLDVVRRYDIDGVHMDDYFYPYPDYLDNKPFPDDDTWAAYQKAGGKLARDDWRRDAVNTLVERWYKETKALKPWVKVGISPFGIGRPGRAPGIKGFDQYDKLYADAELWLQKGWVDYWTPQLYWAIDKKEQSFPVLLNWWASVNPHKRHLWPGLGTYRHPAQEIVEQIKVTRQHPDPGHVHFSMKGIMQNKGGIADALKALCPEPALVPASPWLDKSPPAAPQVAWQDAVLRVTPVGEPVRQFVVRTKAAGAWTTRLVPADGANPVAVKFDAKPAEVRVTAVDRAGNEGEAAR